jgi:hypothetical protein
MLIASLSAAGLIMGFYFNAYALLATNLLLSLAAIVFATQLGIVQAGIHLIFGLVIIQCAYGIGLLASSFLSTSRELLSGPHMGRE